ncbi:MAG: hypothetical protein KatS3mg104_2403 [Phycisphaerae bacterium]|nr:MAG: hypothetical protein KatS3mg104_2403 [Phycisphaerae bacterium]
MIELTCANCRNTLEIDDAFAGGVCRCQYCGTIQTVPKKIGRSQGGSIRQAETESGEPKALYQVKSRAGISSVPSGLEELAEVVHSSGLSSGLMNRDPRTITTATPAQQKASQRTTLIAFIIGFSVVAVLCLIGVIVVFSQNPAPQASPSESVDSVLPQKPTFFNTDLTSEKVSYVVDRGDATAVYFASIKKLLIKSVSSLGPDRRFSVCLWNNGTEDVYPLSGGMTYATADEIRKLVRWLDEVSLGRATTVESALQQAVRQNPGEIVLVTAKSDQLALTDFATEVLNLVKGKTVRIHGFSIGDSPSDDPLKRIAAESGGKFVHITRSHLTVLQ